MNANINNLSSDMRPTASLAGVAIADQSLTVAGTSAAMIATTLNDNTNYVFWTLTGADAYFTLDNSDPVGGSNGHFVAANASGVWSREMAIAAKWIREGATSARLHISELQGK